MESRAGEDCLIDRNFVTLCIYRVEPRSGGHCLRQILLVIERQVSSRRPRQFSVVPDRPGLPCHSGVPAGRVPLGNNADNRRLGCDKVGDD